MADAPTSGTGRRPLPPETGRGRRALKAALWIGAALLLAESHVRRARVHGDDRGPAGSITPCSRRSTSCAPKTPPCAAGPAACEEDPEAIEEIARRDLRLLAPGEIVFIVKDAKRCQVVN